MNKWEENIGFNSVRKLIALAKDEYEQLKTEEDLKIFLSKYENKFTFNDGSIHGNIRWRNISALVNEDGWAYIGDNLYKFEEDKQIIIEGAEENKIDLAETSTSSRLEDGIHVFSKEKLESSQVEARSCGSICTTAYYFYDEDKDSDNNKRLRYWWEGFAVQELLPNGNYNTYYYYAREIESRKKQGFIWKRTWIDVKFDHDVSFCYPSCNFPEDDISFDQTVFDVADYVAFSEILILQDEVASCALYHVTINSVADRIESPNTNDLQCVVSCN